MADLHLTLTDQERDFLVQFLQTALKETSVEEHRTRTLSYRQLVVDQEKLMSGLLQKLGQPGSSQRR